MPSLLPFTIPATLLLTVCVVYGRIAGDPVARQGENAAVGDVNVTVSSGGGLGCGRKQELLSRI